MILFRNGLQMRRNSWNDGVAGTNCAIPPGENWTYVFQAKDEVGSFFYRPSLGLHAAAGGHGPIRVNSRPVIAVPFAQPDGEFDVLIGDWYNMDVKVSSSLVAPADAHNHSISIHVTLRQC